MKNKSYDKKIFRLFHALQRLNGGDFFKTSELAREFNVTARTVQRDLELLDSAGFPLVYENDGYRFMDGFSLQKITVTPAERFLLNSFFNLFSKAGAPLDGVASGFLSKLLSIPKESCSGRQLDTQRKAIIKKEVNELSKAIEAKLEDLTFPTPFKRKVDEFLNLIENKMGGLKKSTRVDMTRSRTYCQREPVATITIAKTYFDDPHRNLDYSAEKNRVFKIKFLLPNQFFKSFRAVLKVDLNFRFWGPHLKAKTITHFDEFAAYLGFSKDEKEFHYEASYGSNSKRAEVLITRASISWQETIPMSKEIVKPFLKKTGGIWLIS
jgi:hypothetical protein